MGRALALTTGPGPVLLESVERPGEDLCARWDELVCTTHGTDVTQLTVWARVRRLEGFRPRYLFVRSGGRLVGGVQVLLRQLPGFGGIGYVAYGPVVAGDAERRPDVVDSLAAGLAGLSGVRMLFVQPPEGGDDLRCALLGRGFRESRAGIAPTGSVRLDLSRSLDDIRGGFPPRLRSWTRRWADHGVTVRLGDESDVPVLARLMRATGDARGYQPPRLEYLRHLYAELAGAGNAALFIGEVDGVPVTADVVTMCGSMVRGRLGGFDRTTEARRLSVPGAARWEIIRWAQRSGYRWLDFGGLAEETLRDAVDDGVRSSDTWPGADRAKMQFGGTPFRYPGAVELIRPRVVRYAYDAASGTEWGRAALHRVKVGMRGRPSRGDEPAPERKAPGT